MSRRQGVTLIELLVAISLTTIVGGAIGMIFNAAMETWRFGDEIASIEAVAPPLVNQISEGDYTNSGIVDALAITEASKNSIGFVPLFLDHFDADAFLNEDQIFKLSYPFQKGSTIPKGQIRTPGSPAFRNVRTAFLPGELEDPPEDLDRVQFLDEIPENARVRIIYRPSHEKDPRVIMRIHWDETTGELTREYLGNTESLGKNIFGVSITEMILQYFTNTNLEILPPSGEELLDDNQRQQITAAKIMLSAKKGDTEKTMVQFVNMRNLGWATTGAVITEGSEVTIPSSFRIRSLAIVNITGVQDDSTLSFQVESAQGTTWLARLHFGLVDEKPALIDYSIEYPEGKVVLNRAVFLPVSRGFDLLTFDETGKYDYDDDNGVEDTVVFDDDPVTFRVVEMGIGGAALHIRP